MRARLALALLLGWPLLCFPGLLQGEVISADDHLGVHPGWADPEAPSPRVGNPHNSDPALQLMALQGAAARAYKQGHLPLWNPDLYGGAPLLADGQSMALHPATLLRAALPADLAQNLVALGVLLSTTLGGALLARRLQAGWAGATLAGLSLGLGPYTQVWLLHPHAAAFALLPWALLALEAAAPVGLALAVAGIALAGHPGTLAHALLILGGWWLVRSRRVADAAGILVGLLLAAPALGPMIEAASGSSTAASRGGNHLPPQAYLDLLWPGALGHPGRETWQGPGAWADSQLHPGPLTLILGLLALRDRRGRGLVAAWALCLLLAGTGLPGPINHARLGEIGVLFVALAAGLGLRRSPEKAHLPVVIAALACGLWMRRDDQQTLPAAAHDPPPSASAAALVAAALDRPILALDWAVQPNLGSRVGLRDLRGYDLPISAQTQRMLAACRPQPQAPWYPIAALPPRGLLRLFAVPLVVVHAEKPLPAGLTALPLPEEGLKAAWIDAAAPQAWLAFTAVPVRSPEEALRRVLADPGVADHPPVEGLTAALTDPRPALALSLVEDGPNALRVTVDPPAPALLVVAAAHAPGWVAEVDGAPRPVLRVGGLVRGVQVEPGDREVRLVYAPTGWTWGLYAGGVGGIGLFGLSLWAWLLRRPRSPRGHAGAPGSARGGAA